MVSCKFQGIIQGRIPVRPRKAEVVTLGFFGGLTAMEIAGELGLSARTVERDWSFAKAWLNAHLAEREEGS